MITKITLGVMIIVASITSAYITPMILQNESAFAISMPTLQKNAPPAITGINVYVAWWTNKIGNDEVTFRASTDARQTLGNKINLSNTTDADSTRVEIDSDGDSIVVTW
jgi:hypothetical protein